MTLSEIIEQLKSCGYTCEAGPLENNIAFQELLKLAGLRDTPGIFSGRWKTERQTVLSSDKRNTRMFYAVLAEIDDEWVYIGDKNTESHLLEFQSRKEAQDYARHMVAEKANQ